MRINRNEIGEWLLLLFLFLLPLQTRYIFRWGTLAGGPWEYGTLGVYITECVLLLVCVFRWADLRRSFQTMRSVWIAVCLALAYAGISLAWAADVWVAVRAEVLLVEAWLIFVLVKEFSAVKKMLTAFVLGVFTQAFFGFVQVVIQWAPAFSWLGMSEHDPFLPGASVVMVRGERFLRAYGGLPHPNILGGFIAVALGCIIWIRMHARRPRTRLLWVLAATFLMVVLFFTFSRTAWIALLAPFGYLLYLAVRSSRLIPRSLYTSIWREAMVVLGIFLITFTVGGIAFHEAFTDRVAGTTTLETRSRQERITGMQDALVLIREQPIFGVGIGNYTVALAERFPNRSWWLYQPVHNVPLLIFAELGLIGFVLLMVVLACTFRKLLTTHYSLQTIFLLPLLAMGLLDHYLWSLSAGLFLAAFAGGISCSDKFTTEIG
ncbi:MAG: O-antigen ligase family protein [bacterium]|nr:O-antigen ligase family protein [bacterium]